MGPKFLEGEGGAFGGPEYPHLILILVTIDVPVGLLVLPLTRSFLAGSCWCRCRSLAPDRPSATLPTLPSSPVLQVVVEGIPCSFTLEPAVESFDLVLMAENKSDTSAVALFKQSAATATEGATAEAAKAAAAAAAAAGGGGGGDGHETDEVVISAEDAAEAVEAEAAAVAVGGGETEEDTPEAAAATDGVEELEAEKAAEADTADAAVANDVAAAVSATADEPQEEVFHDAAGPAEAATSANPDSGETPATTTAAAAATETPTPEAAQQVGDAVAAAAAEAKPAAEEEEEEEAAPASGSVSGEEAAAAASAESAAAVAEVASTVAGEAEAEGEDAAAAAAAAADVREGSDGAQVLIDGAGSEGATETGNDAAAAAAAAAAALATTNGDVAAASPAAAAALGCSTGTTEVVVPSSELDFTLSQGQWRYLEADSTPMHGDDAVEVTKGIRFSTSLKAVDSREDDVRSASSVEACGCGVCACVFRAGRFARTQQCLRRRCLVGGWGGVWSVVFVSRPFACQKVCTTCCCRVWVVSAQTRPIVWLLFCCPATGERERERERETYLGSIVRPPSVVV